MTLRDLENLGFATKGNIYPYLDLDKEGEFFIRYDSRQVKHGEILDINLFSLNLGAHELKLNLSTADDLLRLIRILCHNAENHP